jgi:hypothetical protein
MRATRARQEVASKDVEMPIGDQATSGLRVGQPFNPFGMFAGIVIPETQGRSPVLSPGAKLAYGRLARYAGADGK